MINPPHDRKIEGQIKNTGAPDKPLSKKEDFLSLCSYSLQCGICTSMFMFALSLWFPYRISGYTSLNLNVIIGLWQTYVLNKTSEMLSF